MKIAILGGTFDPVHNGHLVLADTAVKTFGLEEVMFIPAYIPPHKGEGEIADAEDRLAMVKLAIEGNDKFRASRLEINRKNVSYSIDTLSYIKKIYPENTELYFLAGSDSVKTLDTWKGIDKILSMCKFIVGARAGYTLETKYKNIEIMPMTPVDISSAEIRKMVRENKDIRGLVPEKVADYIKRYKLYVAEP